jgi:hypothetical protein
MARIKKLKENGKTVYPATILDAVVDSKTSTPITKTRLRYSRASAHGRYYKFMTLKRGIEKGIIRFGIESPLMGYADYMVNWTYDTNTEKGMNPYCLFSTNAQMYNRVKLVRTGNDTFDVYFESNAGNDYPAFVFMGEGGTTDSNSITSYIVSTVSAIPEDVYKESDYAGNICFGGIDVYAKNWTALFLKNIDIEAVRTCIDFGGKGFVGYDGNSTGLVFGIGGFISPRKSYINVGENGIGYGQGSKIQTIYHAGNLGIATSTKSGLVKSGGGFITVDTDGIVKVNRSQTADNAENDENGDNIVYTYAKKTELPEIATSTVAGIIKGGGDIAVGSDGSVTVNNAGVAQMAAQDSSGRVIVNTYVPKTQIATSSAAGLVKSGNDITVASDGTVTVNSATTVDNIPAATSSKIGGIKSGGDVLVSSSGVVTVNNAASAEEAVHAKTADNATKLNGYGVVVAGETSVKNKIPVVGNDGVVEIGRYLDFHMDGSVEDYNIRLRCDTTGKYQLYLPAKTGTVALTSDIPSVTAPVVIDMGTADFSGGVVEFSKTSELTSYVNKYWGGSTKPTVLPEVYIRYTAGSVYFVKVTSQTVSTSKYGKMNMLLQCEDYLPEVMLYGIMNIEGGTLVSCAYHAVDISSLEGDYPG